MKHIKGKTFVINARTQGQNDYIDNLDRHDVIFGVGPAGTGKTFLAIAMAVKALQSKEVNRIILTRPVVEAGENLGFLPGTLEEKLDPYVIPLMDALRKLMGVAELEQLMQQKIIEIAPLAYMRGRTLEDAFVILDEAQNTTEAQMRMFLTRLGKQSKMVINGDLSQSDLPRSVQSGLSNYEIFRGIKGIGISEMRATDIVRHKLVGKMLAAYDNEFKLKIDI